MEAAAVLLAAVFHHPDAPAFGAVAGGQFFQADHPVGHAVHGLVQGFGGQVVQQQDGGVIAHEVVLDRQDLPPVAQGTLRQQADFRKAVEHHPGRLDPLHHFEDLPRGFPQLQVRGVQQALLVLGVEQAFRRDQLEDVDVLVQLPAVGLRALAQLALGFREGDVQAALAGGGAGPQKMQGHGGLAGTGFAFQQEHMAT